MKIKSTKENNIMPEVTGLKVKDLDTTPPVDSIEPETVSEETTTTEEFTSDTTDNQPTDNPTPDIGGLFNTMITPTEEEPTPPKEPIDDFKKIATARLIDYNGSTIYRFDIFNKEYRKDSGIIELRNVVNGFNLNRPNNKKEYRDFFAMFGIISWNFNSSVMPYEKNIIALITELESLINEHINIAGIKRNKFVFKIDIAEEYKP